MALSGSSSVLFRPLVEIRENPEFHDLMSEEKAHWPRLFALAWPRCLLWHGWLPMLLGVNGALPWAADASESGTVVVVFSLLSLLMIVIFSC